MYQPIAPKIRNIGAPRINFYQGYVFMKRRVNKLREAGMMDKEEAPKSPSQPSWTIFFFRINIFKKKIYIYIYLHNRFITKVYTNLTSVKQQNILRFIFANYGQPLLMLQLSPSSEKTPISKPFKQYSKKKKKKKPGCDDERRTTSCWINKNPYQWNNFDTLENLYNAECYI